MENYEDSKCFWPRWITSGCFLVGKGHEIGFEREEGFSSSLLDQKGY